MLLKCLLVLSLIFFSKMIKCQTIFGSDGKNYFGSGMGMQISGIRKVDYIRSNISPKINIFFGKEINNSLRIQIGYDGFYFKMIANSDKRHYNYWNLIVENQIINIKNSTKNSDLLKCSLQIGGGLFQNKYFKRPNFCGEIGFTSTMKVTKNASLLLRVNSIMGWDLYQGDEDVINGVIMGVKYNF